MFSSIPFLVLMLVVSLEAQDESCNCPLRNPSQLVCGSDGTVYRDNCLFQCTRRAKIFLDQVEIDRCDNDHNPVCGSDGKMYYTECDFKCAQKLIPDLRVEYTGTCS